MPRQLPENLENLLKQTSRAFYLSLSILPIYSRYPLSLAYLLARTADTVADSEADDSVERIAVLRMLQDALTELPKALPQELERFHPVHPGEYSLLKNVREIYREIHTCEPDQRASITEVVKTLIEGMIWDQELFTNGDVSHGLNDDQLDKYTYLVAGCVGPFWSTMCAGGNPHLSVFSSDRAQVVSVEFGKSLQWVNILRDIPKDQIEGRYYLPPMDSPEFSERLHTCAQRALVAFGHAVEYPGYFPVSFFRDRLAVIMPLVLGLRTLEKLFRAGGPRPHQRITVTRFEVFCWLAVGVFLSFLEPALRAVLNRLHERAESALENWRTQNV